MTPPKDLTTLIIPPKGWVFVWGDKGTEPDPDYRAEILPIKDLHGEDYE